MQRSELNLSDYWRIIRRRKAIIIASTLLIGLIVLYQNSTMMPTYQTSSLVMYEGGKSLTTGAPEYYNYYEGDVVEAQTTIIVSAPVAEEAARIVGWIDDETSLQDKDRIVAEIASSVNAEKLRETNLIRIVATSGNAERAADIANAVARGYQSWSLKNRNEQARTVRIFVEGQLAETSERLRKAEDALKEFKQSSEEAAQITMLQSQLMTLELDLASLLQEYTNQHPDVIDTRAKIGEIRAQLERNPGLELEYTRLKREVDTDTTLYANLKQRYEEAKITEAEKVSGITIVNTAAVPASPISPKTKTNTIIATIVGLLLGLVLAFVKENLDTSIATIEDVEDFLSLPILGVIPHVETEGLKKQVFSVGRFFASMFPTAPRLSKREMRKLLVVLGSESSQPAEAYKTLRANIQFAVSQKKGKVIMITSSGPHEGKTITAANVAITFAQSGQRVLLISADMRRGLLAELFGIRKDPGLSNVLSGDVEWKKALRTIEDLMVGDLDTTLILETPGIDNLSILTSGRVPPNPSEFLQSERMTTILKEMREQFDYVFLDCPPVLPVSDALVLAPHMDGVIMVYQAGQTARGAVKRAKTQIQTSGAPILGVVLNAIKASEMRLSPSYSYYGGYYGDKYGYTYGAEEKEKKKEPPNWMRFMGK